MREGWEPRELGDIAEVYDGPHATPSTVDSGPIFLGIGALRDGAIDLGETRHVTREDFALWTRRVRPQANDVVFSYETRLGQAAIIPEGLECCLGRRMGLLRFTDEAVFPRFFLYQYLSPQFQEFLETKTIRGATVDRLSIKEFPSFPVALPPLHEQQRIVALLDEAFASLATAKANAERNLQNARAVFESHLAVTFSQRGDGWAEMSLDEVADPSCTLSYGIVQPREDHLDGLPVVRPTDLAPKVICLEGLKRIDPRRAEGYRRTTLQGSELLLCVRGSTGVVSIAAPELRGANVTRGIVPVRFNPDLVLPELGYYLMKSGHVQSQIREKTYGAALMQINIRDLRAITLFVPSLKEQSVMVLTMSELDAEVQRLTHLYERKLAALEELKQSLLQQAFNGEL